MDSAAARRAGELFESMLLVPILAPLLGGSDALGTYGLDLLASEIARHDSHGFAAIVARRLEQAR